MLTVLQEILKRRRYQWLFVGGLFGFLALFVAIPTLGIAGNDLWFQLSTYNTAEIIFLVVLAASLSLLVTTATYAQTHRRKTCPTSVLATSTTVGGLSGVVASIIATAACAGCIAPIVALFGLGFGALSFLLQYQRIIGLLAIVIVWGFIWWLLHLLAKQRI